MAADYAGNYQDRCREVAGTKKGKWRDFRGRVVFGYVQDLIVLLEVSCVSAGLVLKEQGFTDARRHTHGVLAGRQVSPVASGVRSLWPGPVAAEWTARALLDAL